MANPALTALTADTWEKVATAITSGSVYIANTVPKKYLADYRLTGGAAPADDDTAINFTADGVAVFTSDTAIDVYIKPVGAAGAVVVHV